jgi:hypothetical protein
MKKVLIGIAIVGVVGLGVGIYLYKRQNKLSETDYNDVVALSNFKGFDLFEDVSPKERKKMKENYLKYFNRDKHNQYIDLLKVGQSKFTKEQLAKYESFNNLIIKGLV